MGRTWHHNTSEADWRDIHGMIYTGGRGSNQTSTNPQGRVLKLYQLNWFRRALNDLYSA
jgi:hypothetical protein